MKRLGITNTGTVVLPLIDLSLVLVVVCGESATATPEPTERPCRPGTSVPTCPFRRAGQGTGQLTTAPLRSDLLNRPRCQPRSRPLPLSPPLPEQLAPRGHSTPASEKSIPMPLHPSLSSTIQAQFVGSGIGETPVSQDVNDVFQTELFSDWEVAEDGLTWTFTVRKGVPFHKGYGEMTADDFDMLLRLAVPTAGQSPASGRPRNWATKAVQRRHTLAPQHQGPGLGRTP